MTRGTVDESTVCAIIASVLPRAGAGAVEPSMSLQGDLGLDSVGLMSLVFVLEEQTGVDTMSCLERFIEAEYVRDVVDIVCSN